MSARRHRYSRHHIKSKLYRIFIYLLLPIFLIFAFVKGTTIFNIQSITCTQGQATCSQDILDSLYLLQNRFLPTLTLSDIQAALPQHSIVNFSKKLPSSLTLEIAAPHPVATLSIQSQNFSVSSSGLILGQSTFANLPLVRNDLLPTDLKEISDHNTMQAIKLAIYLRQSNFPTEVISIRQDNAIHLTDPSGISILISPDQDPLIVATTLQQLLAKVKMAPKPPRHIDLRFQQPILTY